MTAGSVGSTAGPQHFRLWCETVADICSDAVPPSPVGVWEEERQKQNHCGVALRQGRHLPVRTTQSHPIGRRGSGEAGQLAPTAGSQMTIGQASLMQKLITIMEHKVGLSGQIVNDKSVLPSRTSYVCKARLALALSDHADDH